MVDRPRSSFVEKRGSVERGEFSPKIDRTKASGSVGESLLKQDEEIVLYEKAVGFLEATGMSDLEAHAILSDETNPYAIWFLDGVKRFGGDLKIDKETSGKTGKVNLKYKGEIVWQNYLDLMIVWKSLIYPRFSKLVRKYGFKLSDYKDVFLKMVDENLKYPHFDTWAKLTMGVGFPSEFVDLTMLIELNELAGLPVDELSQKLGKIKEKELEQKQIALDIDSLGSYAPEFYKKRVARLEEGKGFVNDEDYIDYALSLVDMAKQVIDKYPELSEKIENTIMAYGQFEDDVLNSKMHDFGIGQYMEEWDAFLYDDPGLKRAAGFMEDLAEELFSSGLDYNRQRNGLEWRV
ncbi:hypothetical protein HOG17_02525 [Candidatus Peregrinibacteria bacterium]|jgi:hypothetical protein|nr:hypothetical protein [Candidatus Peregrinibacteria bacterium]MBT4147920.1 hypothetical protein [Candidatus Peregrinibacteria bacterium]MBT4365977.1 hypothetical protein [Candidatus Peregrinibacteria bacterium]MBT4456411.1 hypothetical protein [Candidatus Peregrinibacteria bacterium]